MPKLLSGLPSPSF